MIGEPQIVDSYGYVSPAAELLYDSAAPELRGHWPQLEEHLVLTAVTAGIGDWGSSYLRFATEPNGGSAPSVAEFPRPPRARDDVEIGVLHDNPQGRLRALDRAGIDVQVLNAGPTLDAVMALPLNAAVAVLGAYNRYLATYCAADPQRLKAVIQVHGGAPQWSAREILDCAADPSIAAVTVHLPVKIAPDERNFEVVWDALEQTGLPLLHRPGCSAHLWSPGRLASYLVRTGVLERWPGVGIVFAGWPVEALAAWSAPDGRFQFAVETIDDHDERQSALTRRDPGALVWGSHFPFDRRDSTAQVRAAIERDASHRRALAENPHRFLRTAGAS